MRLIDADALKDEFPKDSDWEYPVNTNEYVCEMIDAQPTMKPKRPKGKWIPQDHNKSDGFSTTLVYYFPKCSECGHSGDNAFAFCPWCGADMKG